MKTKIIFQEVQKIIPEVYLVGGSVRDILLGKNPKDYDFCTPMLPEEIQERVEKAGRKPYLTGKRFGTIGFKVEVSPREFEYVEVTTFRGEKYESGNRKPEVNFVTSLEEDLSRRDFTINALAWNCREPKISLDGMKIDGVTDLFNGLTDLLVYPTIRCVGNPKIRFKEDPLRLLRCARFVSQLGFAVEEQTEKKAKECANSILTVSRERWMQELDKLLLGHFAVEGLQFLARTRILNYIVPELALQVGYNQNNPHHSLTLWEHTLKVVGSLPKDIDLLWSGLLHDIGKPFVRTDNPKGHCNYIMHELVGAEIVLKYANYLKWSKERTELVYNRVREHMKDDSILKPYDREAK